MRDDYSADWNPLHMDANAPPIDPIVGIVFKRDAHPGIASMADVADHQVVSRALCDERLPLSEALARSWTEDAHVLMYALVDESGDALFARANKRSQLPAQIIQIGGQIRVSVLVFDHDLPKLDGGTKQVWSGEGLGEFVQGLSGADLPQPTYWYTTLHGSRFVYVLTEPVDHLRCEALMGAIMARFLAAGVVLDPARSDWTGLYRLPKTVREDTGCTFADDPMFLMVDGGPALDPSTIDVGDVCTIVERFAEVKPYDADMPDPDDVRKLLYTYSDKGRQVQSDWVKEAKTYLQGREAYGVCFEEKRIDVSGGWNDAVTRLVGQVVGMTARVDSATPEGVFALIHGGLEQLQADEDAGAKATHWLPKAWDIVCRMWANEQAQVQVENLERARSVEQAKGVRREILSTIRDAAPHIVPPDPEAAEEWLRQRMIASDGRHHYVMRPDASYNVRPVPDSMLVPIIRELGMEDVIQTSELRGRAWVPRSAQAILNDHASFVTGVVCSSRERIAYIDGEVGGKILHLPVHRLNPKLAPGGREDRRVGEWLVALFGSKIDLGIEWLSWALEVGAPICALNLYGASGAGKGMLAQGLAECFDGERMNDGRALGKYNEGLLHSPIVNCDEGVPEIRSDESLAVDQAFRAFVSGGRLIIRSMYRDPFNADVYPRILFTGNDPDVIRSIVGHRDLTDEDIRAIELRLLSIQIGDGARDLLCARGNYDYTRGWIHGSEKSKYVLANHIAWLYANRKPSRSGSGRLLVEGEQTTSLVRAMRLRTQASQAVLKAIVRMVESPGAKRGLVIEGGRTWVTPAGVVDYIDSGLSGISEKVSLSKCNAVLRQFAAKQVEGEYGRPPGAKAGRWVEVDLGVVLEEGMRYGMACERTEALLRTQPNGATKAAVALAHKGDD